MSKHLTASLTVLVLAIAGVFLVREIKDRTNFSEGVGQEINLIDKMEAEGVPDFTSQYVGGQPFQLSKFKGKILIINFWASWCDPCVREFPSMVKLIEKFNGDVVLIAVSHDYEAKDIETFLKSMGGHKPNMEILWDKEFKIANQFGTKVLPESYLVGKDFKLIRKVVGIDDWATPEAIGYFEDLVAGREIGPAKKPK